MHYTTSEQVNKTGKAVLGGMSVGAVIGSALGGPVGTVAGAVIIAGASAALATSSSAAAEAPTVESHQSFANETEDTRTSHPQTDYR